MKWELKNSLDRKLENKINQTLQQFKGIFSIIHQRKEAGGILITSVASVMAIVASITNHNILSTKVPIMSDNKNVKKYTIWL